MPIYMGKYVSIQSKEDAMSDICLFIQYAVVLSHLSRPPIRFSFRNMDCNQAFMHLGFMITYSTLSLYHFVYVVIIMIRVVFQVGSSFIVIC